MKTVSQLIKRLQELQSEHGDLPVYVWDDGLLTHGFTANYEPQDISRFPDDLDTLDPERIQIMPDDE